MTKQTETDTPTAAKLELRLAAIENSLDSARSDLEEAQAAYGDAVIGKGPGEADKAAKRVKERQAALERLQAAYEALQRRLVDAREREAAEAHVAKWNAFAEALEARTAAFDRAEKLAGAFFKAVSEAVAASWNADVLTPVEKVLTPSGWAVMPQPFQGMARMKDEELVVVRNALRDITKKSRETAVAALSMRAHDKPGNATRRTPVEPTAAESES